MNQESKQALSVFLEKAKAEFNAFADTIGNDAYVRRGANHTGCAKNMNRVHITGIGKPSHVANYMASLLSSTELRLTSSRNGAVHGSCGQLVPGDVVICISNSGETAELKATAWQLKITAVKSSLSPEIRRAGLPNSPTRIICRRQGGGRAAQPRAPRIDSGRNSGASGIESLFCSRFVVIAAGIC
jgi:arabinose-5-phosphate isomerase